MHITQISLHIRHQRACFADEGTEHREMKVQAQVPIAGKWTWTQTWVALTPVSSQFVRKAPPLTERHIELSQLVFIEHRLRAGHSQMLLHNFKLASLCNWGELFNPSSVKWE